MSIRVQGTCQSRACEGWQPPHGSPLSQVFLRNLQRRQARSFLISWACCRWSGRRGPRRLPTRFSVTWSFLVEWAGVFLTIVFATLLPTGLFLLRPGGEFMVDDVGEVDSGGDCLVGRGSIVIDWGLTEWEWEWFGEWEWKRRSHSCGFGRPWGIGAKSRVFSISDWGEFIGNWISS